MFPSVVDRFEDLSATRSDQIALLWENETWTFARLIEEALKLSRQLVSMGAAGARVGVCVSQGPRHIAALLAVWKTKATAVPFDCKWSISQVSERVSVLKVQFLIAQSSNGFEITSTDVEPLTSARDVRIPFLLAATGGTSGTLKAISISEQATILRFFTQSVEFGISGATSFLNSTPLFHGGGRSFVLAQLYFGGSVILHDHFDSSEFRMSLEEVDFGFAVPTMVQRLAALRRPMGPKCKQGSLIVSGAPVSSSIGMELRQIGVQQAYDYYASVETGGISVRRWRAGRFEKSRTVYGVKLQNLPDVSGHLQGFVSDDVWVSSMAVADGAYVAGVFVEYPKSSSGERVFKLSDRIRFWPDGSFLAEGRSDDLIISGGVNIDPREVEAEIRAFPSVADAIVAGYESAEWGEAVGAIIVLESGQGFEIESLKEALRNRLASSQMPKRFVVVSEIPNTTAGKVDRAWASRVLAEWSAQ